MVGGFLGLCGAFFLGPRFRRFDKSASATSFVIYFADWDHMFVITYNL